MHASIWRKHTLSGFTAPMSGSVPYLHAFLLQGNCECGFVALDGAEGFDKPGQVPPSGGNPANITINFADVDLFGSITVYDIWAQAVVGTFTNSYTAVDVPYHGSAFLRLSAAA